MYFATSYGFYFLVTWLPSYLIREHGLTQQSAGFYSGFLLALGAVACLTGGLLSDWLVARTGSLKWGRRLVGFGSYTFAALGYAGRDGHDRTRRLGRLRGSWGCFGGTAAGFMNSSSSLSANDLSPGSRLVVRSIRIVPCDVCQRLGGLLPGGPAVVPNRSDAGRGGPQCPVRAR
jgi:MFS family permease